MILRVVVSLLVAWFTWQAGHRGLYLFDSAIFYQYGWLIKNGLRPFVDFLTPVTPLCGWLVALAYSLLGVSYESGVQLTALLAGGGFALASWSLERTLGRWLAWGLALALSLVILPSFSIPAYNQLAAWLIMFWCLAWVNQLHAPNRWAQLGIQVSVALLWLVKLHLGILYLALGLLLEFIDKTKRNVRSLGLHAIAPSLALLILLISCGFQWQALTHNLFGLATPYPFSLDKLSANYLLDVPRDILIQPQMTLFFFAVVFAVLTWICFRWQRAGLSELRLVLLALGILGIQSFATINSGEPPALNVAYGLLLLLVGLVILRARTQSQVAAVFRHLPEAVALPFLIAVVGFAVSYAWLGARKNWDENTYKFDPSYHLRLSAQTQIPFLSSLQISPIQAGSLDLAYRFVQANPHLSYYFGPELDMLYPATGRLPPKGWPVWTHPGVTYNNGDLSPLYQSFQEFSPDVVILSRARVDLIRFLVDYINKNYVLIDFKNDPAIWVQVLVKKGRESQLRKF